MAFSSSCFKEPLSEQEKEEVARPKIYYSNPKLLIATQTIFPALQGSITASPSQPE